MDGILTFVVGIAAGILAVLFGDTLLGTALWLLYFSECGGIESCLP